MVDSAIVKRKRRQKIAAIVSGVSSLTLGVLIIVAFLGKVVGTFTVSIKQNNTKLSMSTKADMSNSGTYLWINHVPQLDLYTNEYLNTYYGDEMLDSAEHDWHIGEKNLSNGKTSNLLFFKYTFFVKNNGKTPVNYLFDLNIVENVMPTNVGYGLDDILRVRLYENNYDPNNPTNAAPLNNHNYETYAKRTRNDVHMDEDGNLSYAEAISTPSESENFYGYATEFASNEVIVSKYIENFAPEAMKRYTLVFWLEGYDPQAVATPPENCSLKLGVNITADESEEDQ